MKLLSAAVVASMATRLPHTAAHGDEGHETMPMHHFTNPGERSLDSGKFSTWCPPGSTPRGLFLEFDSSKQIYNHIGNHRGGLDMDVLGCHPEPGVRDYSNLECPCGCGCNCTRAEHRSSLRPAGVDEIPDAMHFRKTGIYFDGTGGAEDFDVVISNSTPYKPWNTARNGHRSAGTFAQINLHRGTATTFKFEFKKTSDGSLLDIPFGARPTHSTSTPRIHSLAATA